MAAFLPRLRADHSGEHDSGADPREGTGATWSLRCELQDSYGRTPKVAKKSWLLLTLLMTGNLPCVKPVRLVTVS